MKKIVVVIGALLVIVAVGGGSFWAGMKVEENRVIQNPASFFQRFREQGGQFSGQFGTPPAGFPGAVGTPQPGGEAGRMGGGIMGTIKAVEGDTLVVTTEEGEVRVQTTDTTLIEKNMAVDVGNLEVGEQVVVSGSRNDDGSVTARSIRISTAR